MEDSINKILTSGQSLRSLEPNKGDNSNADKQLVDGLQTEPTIENQATNDRHMDLKKLKR